MNVDLGLVFSLVCGVVASLAGHAWLSRRARLVAEGDRAAQEAAQAERQTRREEEMRAAREAEVAAAAARVRSQAGGYRDAPQNVDKSPSPPEPEPEPPTPPALAALLDWEDRMAALGYDVATAVPMVEREPGESLPDNPTPEQVAEHQKATIVRNVARMYDTLVGWEFCKKARQWGVRVSDPTSFTGSSRRWANSVDDLHLHLRVLAALPRLYEACRAAREGRDSAVRQAREHTSKLEAAPPWPEKDGAR